MNPIIGAAALLHLQRLSRACPRCGHHQVVSARMAHSTVRCARCGESLPPPKPARRP